MKKYITLSAIASVFLIIAVLFTSLRLVMNSESRHAREYERLNVSERLGMSSDDILASLMVLVDYMEDRRDDIKLEVSVFGETMEMFNERETLHMEDVKDLFLTWRTASYLLFAVAVMIFAIVALILKKNALFAITRGFLWGLGFICAIGIVITLWAVIDFNSFWTAFHLLFFDNDLWLLDGRTSRMINMLPSEFFSNIILEFITLGVGVILLLGASALIHIVSEKRRKLKNNF